MVADGETYEEALADAKSAVEFHIETFGPLQQLQRSPGADLELPEQLSTMVDNRRRDLRISAGFQDDTCTTGSSGRSPSLG